MLGLLGYLLVADKAVSRFEFLDESPHHGKSGISMVPLDHSLAYNPDKIRAHAP